MSPAKRAAMEVRGGIVREEGGGGGREGGREGERERERKEKLMTHTHKTESAARGADEFVRKKIAFYFLFFSSQNRECGTWC